MTPHADTYLVPLAAMTLQDHHSIGRHRAGRKRRMPADPVELHAGQQLRQRRLAAGLSFDELAQAIGVTSLQLAGYETARTGTAAATLWRIAQALAIPLSAFFPPARPATGAPSPAPTAADDALTPSRQIRGLPDDVRARISALTATLISPRRRRRGTVARTSS